MACITNSLFKEIEATKARVKGNEESHLLSDLGIGVQRFVQDLRGSIRTSTFLRRDFFLQVEMIAAEDLQ